MGIPPVPPTPSSPPPADNAPGSSASTPSSGRSSSGTSGSSSSGSDISKSAMEAAFRQMLGPSATSEDIAQAINNLLNSVISEIKKDQARSMEALKKMRKIIEGEEG